ncbi:glycosyltransferase family 2 protein [Cupriavidus necator]|uniref:Glycosyltransferase family 2 protein n=1 Tax=Cupriavidus necator TaxID=106590 RepID=A0A367PJD6_CUPNE|nr:glycosyltransferase family 2 protein [Cupriavidus necator]QQX85184.1 glycosyltransferase family 2 protein [Cupriavidus necator]RCJ08009.1 glycosyltransferase family 2 protein [Cupriavidus necator]
MRVSAVIITRNEAHNIGPCLESVSWCEEAIIVDWASTDDTAAIARAAGATVIQTDDWPGFGPQKNRAVDAATGDWILSLDADERVTPALRDEILGHLKRADAHALALPRLSAFCGTFVRHAGWYPDYVTRVFRKGRGRFTDDLVHEHLKVDDPVTHLREPLIHYSYRTLSDVLRKIDSYSSAGAQQAYARGKRSSVASAAGHGLWAFIRTYLLKRGFLDGSAGFGVALMNAQASYYKYAKLAQLQVDTDLKAAAPEVTR